MNNRYAILLAPLVALGGCGNKPDNTTDVSAIITQETKDIWEANCIVARGQIPGLGAFIIPASGDKSQVSITLNGDGLGHISRGSTYLSMNSIFDQKLNDEQQTRVGASEKFCNEVASASNFNPDNVASVPVSPVFTVTVGKGKQTPGLGSKQ